MVIRLSIYSLFLCSIVVGQAVQRPPNIVLIVADDLGWSDLGIQGSRYYDTPHLDQLAREGLRFTSAYANAPNCAPTRASLMSGKYGPRHGVFTVGSPWRAEHHERRLVPPENKTTLAPEEFTLAEALREAGYRTGHFGKWHLGEPGTAGPTEQGFDVNRGGTSAGHPPSYFSPYGITTLVDGPPGEYLTDQITEEALSFIEDSADRPFFLYVPHFAVHTPIQGKKDLVERYRSREPWHGQSNPEYAAMLESLDQSVGRIREKLAQMDLAENTVILFTSDNGGLGGYAGPIPEDVRWSTDNYPLRGGKGQLYEGGIRVPLIVYWPGVTQAGSLCHEPTITLDLYPTLAEIAGTKPPPGVTLDGHSVVPLLRGRKKLDRDALFWFFPAYLEAYRMEGLRTSPAAAIRDGNYKLLWFFEDDRLEFYNLDGDIGEARNLVREEAARAEELHQRLKEWLEQVDAPLPRPNPEYKPAAAARLPLLLRPFRGPVTMPSYWLRVV